MERTSRFQNPIPLSNGGFSKNPPSQNDGVGAKIIPSLILDRFRALVKKKEEEIRVFDDGVGLPLNTDEIVRIYEILLSELTTNLKPIITDLTIIAGEQRVHGEGIADVICARIIEVSVDKKLPSLYLLDSIVKNIGKEYIKYFSVNLPEVFCEAYSQAQPNMHSAMRHLFGTWSSVFPLSVLQHIETQLQFSPSVNGRTSVASKASDASRPPLGIHVNAKYFEEQNQFGRSNADTFATKRVSPTTTSDIDVIKKPIPPAARINKSSAYRIGSLSSPSIEEFSMENNSPTITTVRDEEMNDWRKRKYQANPNSSQQLKKASGAYKYKNTTDIDLKGPRALISAYGMDEREKNVNRNHHTVRLLDTNGNASIRPWQNTEEEEFDWEDMTTPSLADRKSSLAKNSFPTNHGASFVSSYNGSMSKAQLPSVAKSLIAEDVSNITDGHDLINGVLQNVAGGPNDLTLRIPPNFTRDPLVLPHQLPQSQYSGYTRTMPQIPNFRPNMIRPQDPRQNLHFPSSNTLAPPLNHGYLGQKQVLHPSLPIPNTPFHGQRPPFFTTNQRPPTASTGPALSGLFSSLVAQGLISLTNQDSVGVEFEPESLKVRHESTITALYSDLPRQCTTCGLRFKTQEEHSKHMDWHVNRNRNLKNRKTKPSPKWFVSATMWLTGAEALGTETAPGFLPVENSVEEEHEEVAVPADEEQNACALCGEAFEDFYSDETEEWMYRGAVYMNGPAGPGIGRSELGPIVHAKCRSDSHGVSSEDFKKDEGGVD